MHNDHLGTPKVITNEAGAVVWSAVHDPFGMATINPGSTVEMNVRYPGQYYDAETGLHYNYFRTYDPSTGRYLESDPIGIEGGLNTYSYVGGNPINKIDPKGLVDCGWWNNNCEFGDPPDSTPRCVTGECAAGLPPTKHDLRPQCEVEKDQCIFTCQMASSIGGAIIGRALGGGLIGGSVILLERKSLCEISCGINHGF